MLGSIEERRELADGYAFRCPAATRPKLEEFVALWRTGFPALSVDLEPTPETAAMWLRISGPSGTREFLDELLSVTRRDPAWEGALSLGVRVLTSPLRVLPDFLMIGAAKCGTSALYSYISQHPDVIAAHTKEPYFFTSTFRGNPLRRSLLWYRAQFPRRVAKRAAPLAGERPFITGEATPCYLFYPHAARRALAAVPNAKLIVLLRDPVAAAYSFYQMKLRRGIETRPFGEAVERETERLSGELEKELADDNYYSFARDHFSYVARGMYADQLERWMACFPREQFLILKTEDFNRDRSRVYGEVLDFLGLAAWEPASFERTNYGGPYLRMESATHDRLKAFFAPHNQRLYALIGRDLGWE